MNIRNILNFKSAYKYLGYLKNWKRTHSKPASFDDDWYKLMYQKLFSSKIEAWDHYDTIGWKIGLDPNEYFWTSWYLEQNPDVFTANINPFLHYENHGHKEGRAPSPKFDADWYRETYDLKADVGSPIKHYMSIGKKKGFWTNEKILLSLSSVNDHALRHNCEYKLILTRRIKRKSKWNYYEDKLLSSSEYLAKNDIKMQEKKIKLSGYGSDIISWAGNSAIIKDCAIVSGASTIITASGIINDEICQEDNFEKDQAHVKTQNAWIKNKRLGMRYKVELTPKITSGLHLMREYDTNYFHFVCEVVPKLLVFEKLMIDTRVPILITQGLSEQFLELIELVKSPGRDIISLSRDIPYAVNELHYLPHLSFIADVYKRAPHSGDTMLPVHLLRQLKNLITDRFSSELTSESKLYVIRGSNSRKVTNEAQIIDHLKKLGFEIVDMRNLSFLQQAKKFYNSSVIISPIGASLTNLLWCRPGTKVIVFTSDHPYTNRTFWDVIASLSDLRMSFISGPRSYSTNGKYSIHDNYSIDLKDIGAINVDD
jgi:capsular polysaccharide biosynthesis protein